MAKELSRQRKWQLKKVAEGKCAICAKPLKHYKGLCDEHAVKARKSLRARNGFQVGKAGMKGRPAIVKKGE